jgi:hypothetical protein
MPPIDFPSAPVNGQEFDAPNGTTYVYLDPPGVWQAKPAALPGSVVQAILATDTDLPDDFSYLDVIDLGTLGEAGEQWHFSFDAGFASPATGGSQYYGARVTVAGVAQGSAPVTTATGAGVNAWCGGSAVVTLAAPSAIKLQAKTYTVADGKVINQTVLTATRIT